MKFSLTQKLMMLIGAAALGAVADRWLFPVMSEGENLTAKNGAGTSLLADSRRVPMNAEVAAKLDRFVNRKNTAAVWAALAKEFPNKDAAVVRAALEIALKAPLAHEGKPWKDPARSRTEALVELLLLWQVPEMATDLLVQAPKRIGSGLLMRAFRAHYQKDATTAKALAASLPRGDWGNLSWLEREVTPGMPPPGGIRLEQRVWTLPDPLAETDACLAALDALPAHERQGIVKGMYRSQGGVGSPVSNFWKGYPEIAARFVERLPPGEERGNEVRTVAEALAQTEPEKALAWLDSLEDFASTEWSYSSVLQVYAERDPQAAAAWIDGRASDARSQRAVSSVAGHWAGEDPQAAMAWARSLSDPELRQTALANSLGKWTQDDPSSALAFAFEQAEGPERQQSLRSVFQSYGYADFEAAWKEAQRLEGEDFTTALSGMLVHTINIRADDLSPFKDAVNVYAASGPTKPEFEAYDPVLKAHARSLSRQDAPGALAWALSLPLGHAREASLSGVFVELAREDPYSTSEILATLTPGRDRDVAITSAFEGLNQRDPERAFQWALSAESSETQLELAQKAFRNWSGDFTTFRQAVETSPDLDASTREQLLQALAARQSR